MNTEILGSVLQIVALVVLSYPLGRYIAKVYKGYGIFSRRKIGYIYFTDLVRFYLIRFSVS